MSKIATVAITSFVLEPLPLAEPVQRVSPS
jgi:hypothetical protein